MAEIGLAAIIEVVEAALRADLTIPELHVAWPQPPEDPYLRAVREDVEFALEHIPGRRSGPRRFGFGWRTGPLVTDQDVWPTQPEYGDLMDHLDRLRAMQREGLNR